MENDCRVAGDFMHRQRKTGRVEDVFHPSAAPAGGRHPVAVGPRPALAMRHTALLFHSSIQPGTIVTKQCLYPHRGQVSRSLENVPEQYALDILDLIRDGPEGNTGRL